MQKVTFNWVREMIQAYLVEYDLRMTDLENEVWALLLEKKKAETPAKESRPHIDQYQRYPGR